MLSVGRLLALLVAIGGFYALEDWSQWRGPNRDGQVVGLKLPKTWPKELEQRWQVEVGLGHSSPVIAEKKIFVFSRRGEDEVLAAFNLADGKQLWNRGYAAPYEVNPVAAAHGKGPKATPAIVGTRVVTLGISGIVTCWETAGGKQIWQRDFSKQFKKTSPIYGASASPLLVDEKCIVHVGGENKGAIMALDVKTGETLWTCPIDGPAYSSPIVVTLADERQVVTQSQKACLGIGLEDGKPLWQIPFTTEYDQNAVTPVEYQGSLIFSGVNRGVDRYRIERTDDEWQTDATWENKEVSLYMSSPVVDGERLFGFSHRHKGQLFAIDLTTGKTLWTSEGRLAENAAVVQSGKVLWALLTTGELVVFAASDKSFQPIARYQVAESPTWAHPVLLQNAVLVKDETKLTLWQFPKEK